MGQAGAAPSNYDAAHHDYEKVETGKEPRQSRPITITRPRPHRGAGSAAIDARMAKESVERWKRVSAVLGVLVFALLVALIAMAARGGDSSDKTCDCQQHSAAGQLAVSADPVQGMLLK